MRPHPTNQHPRADHNTILSPKQGDSPCSRVELHFYVLCLVGSIPFRAHSGTNHLECPVPMSMSMPTPSIKEMIALAWQRRVATAGKPT